jgi:hypothetical protein
MHARTHTHLSEMRNWWSSGQLAAVLKLLPKLEATLPAMLPRLLPKLAATSADAWYGVECQSVRRSVGRSAGQPASQSVGPRPATDARALSVLNTTALHCPICLSVCHLSITPSGPSEPACPVCLYVPWQRGLCHRPGCALLSIRLSVCPSATTSAGQVCPMAGKEACLYICLSVRPSTCLSVSHLSSGARLPHGERRRSIHAPVSPFRHRHAPVREV